MRNDLLGGNANFITEIGIAKYNGSFTVIQLEVITIFLLSISSCPACLWKNVVGWQITQIKSKRVLFSVYDFFFPFFFLFL